MKTIKYYAALLVLAACISSCVVRGSGWVPGHYAYGQYGGREWIPGHYAR